MITEPLTYVYNLSPTQVVFPDELKLANVRPLYKNDDPYAFSNYRPVSLLNVLSKVFEKVIYNRLIEFLEIYKIIVNQQIGFQITFLQYGFNDVDGQIDYSLGK